MEVSGLLVANRGEIAIRILRCAAELGVRTVAVYSEDDRECLHVTKAGESRRLPGVGARAYLDLEAIVTLARESGCDAIHPGYGFLSENADFARRCAEEGLRFVGPSPRVLDLLGDKVQARSVAAEHGVPVVTGTCAATSLEEARDFLASLGEGQAMILKAMAGGGGRGVRVVRHRDELAQAYARCQSEAQAAFGRGDLYVERYIANARHVEVQIVGDGSAVLHLGERDCSLQRRHQKLVEIAPAPGLDPALRQDLLDAAVRLARGVGYENLGTFEFLVETSSPSSETRFAFIEANPRLQVEHTVTEEVTGLDLVELQLRLAAGASLDEIRHEVPELPVAEVAPRGYAIQARINMETMGADGAPQPSGGTLAAFDPPAGPGVRVDSFGYSGYTTSPHFDSLLAKVIVHHPAEDYGRALTKLERALAEFRIDGVSTNLPYLQGLLEHPGVRGAEFHTRFIDEHHVHLAKAATAPRPSLFFGPSTDALHAGARVDPNDPLAVLTYGQSQATRRPDHDAPPPAPGDGSLTVSAPMQGTVVSIEVAEGDAVRAGQALLVMEAMKMEHEIQATTSGVVERIVVAVGDTLYPGHPLLTLQEADVDEAGEDSDTEVDLSQIRADLDEVLGRRRRTRDEARPQAVERRAAKGQRTARANVQDLCDPGTFLEYGPLVLAAQRRRRSVEELIEKSPADGMVTGVGSINGELFPDPASRCAVLAYDYTVFAGTQGTQNHRKTDRLICVAEREGLPLVLFAEGGGGRPGDTDSGVGGPGDTRTFSHFAKLSGWVPLVGITCGRCFAGNASLLGCCDVIIATRDSNIGMGGPAMIEGGGLGVFAPEDIGPMTVQVANGVVDVAVADEAEAVAVAKQYLSYFQGTLPTWEAHDQRLLRRIVPENRLRVYDVRQVICTLADAESVLELRRQFGPGMVTALIRVEGRPLGVVANNPVHLGGAIDSDGADKAARFLQLCDAFDLPVLFLCDTPGIMVGPEVEKTALVRHANRMFLIGANLSVPYFTIVLRKAYGLGAIAMAGGSYKEPTLCVSWPTGEFGGMGLEGAVKLGYRNELAAIADPQERLTRYNEMVAAAYEHGKALNQASLFGIDDAIDPAESRDWVSGLLRSVRPRPPRQGKKRPAIDGW